MANLQYIADNLVESASAVTVSTEDSTYEKENLYNRRPGKPFKFTTTAGNIVIDFGSATSIDSIAVIGHNIDSGATTIDLEGNAADSWGAPSLTEAVTQVDTNMYKIFTSDSYRYWRFVVAGAAATVKIGELILGVSVTLTNNYQWGMEKARTYKNISLRTEYGQPWTYQLYNQRNYNLSFNVNDTTVTELETLHAAVEGGNKPFTMINWDSEAVYVQMPDSLSFQRNFTNLNESKIKLIEVPQGKDI